LSDRPSDFPALPPETWSAAPRQRFHDRYWRHIVLFLLTIVTTTYVGGCHYTSYRVVETGGVPAQLFSDFIPNGFWYSFTFLAILGSHELGHYLMCRYHNVDATLPFFLPAPLPITGTLGAFIRIREPFPNRRVLFDIGFAGPIAGFLVLIPFLFVGLAWSPPVAPPDPKESGIVILLGEPLLYQLADRIVWGMRQTDWINIHPMALAALLGQFVTALNLFPFGQFDGGHISYAALGRRSTIVSLVTVVAAVGLTFISPNWYLVAGIMVVMLIVLGPRHPSMIHEDEELGPGRRLLAISAVVIFVLCFTPSPLRLTELAEVLTTAR
jgi:membrane-associated protease RseP (regulator of RpoE activity)